LIEKMNNLNFPLKYIGSWGSVCRNGRRKGGAAKHDMDSGKVAKNGG
jgi:hypothetical protein